MVEAPSTKSSGRHTVRSLVPLLEPILAVPEIRRLSSVPGGPFLTRESLLIASNRAHQLFENVEMWTLKWVTGIAHQNENRFGGWRRLTYSQRGFGYT